MCQIGWIWKLSRELSDSYINQNCKKIGDAIESPLIKISYINNKESKWILRLYPKGVSEEKSNYVSVQLISLNKYKISSELVSIVSGLMDNKEVQIIHKLEKCESFPYSGAVGGVIDFKRNLIVDEIHNCLKFNELSITYLFSSLECEPQMDDILLKLVEKEGFGDVEIHVRGRKFRAHRILLSSQSENFNEIFSNGEGEQQNSAVTIDDVSHQVFAEILRFIYYNKIQEIGKYAKGLFAVAEKYSMQALRKFCEEEVSKSVTCENAIEYLDLVDQFDLEELKKKVIEFMALNFKTISKSTSFASLKNTKSDLLFELIQVLGNKIE
ncbi:hypothetical protein QAD02_011049 [Eretmocerus hayati]|uniref:Uncharacterized protein n=1 Tax=Eretmocerus hayati TaxID=131215 RepID=A0ACC2NVP1_9HYME|nr:hypothetical protein QAD02_011049 [Eretmocerus hayati]